ncbi:MAG: hypothetical protein K0S99_144 [Thermomicrobiales bacterium]|jgi:hypothetical protein|nr:hypothetical protein [Thermomicrobiales bacterium]
MVGAGATGRDDPVSRSVHLCPNRACHDPVTGRRTILVELRSSGDVIFRVPVRWIRWKQIHRVTCPHCGTPRVFPERRDADRLVSSGGSSRR